MVIKIFLIKKELIYEFVRVKIAFKLATKHLI